MTQRSLHAAQILWPAFLFAGLLEIMVFAWVDPSTLQIGRWQPAADTVYSLAFLAFWALIALATAASHWLMRQQADVTKPIERRVRRTRSGHAAARP